MLEDIFAEKDLNLLISGNLSIVVSENDSISRSICFICRARLYDFRDFQLRCLEVQEVLQSQPTPVVKNEPLNESEDAGPSSEADGELTIADAEENLQPTVVAAEHGNRIRCLFQDEPLEEADEVGPSSEATGELTIAVEENLQSTVVAAEHGTRILCVEVQDVVQNELTPAGEEEPLVDTKDGRSLTEADGELIEPMVVDENLQPIVVAAEHGNKISNPTFRQVTKRIKYDHEKTIRRTRMEGHQNKHKGLQPYKCIFGCKNVNLHSRQVQRYHYRNVHNVQQYECDICDKLFQSRTLLNNHKRIAHTPGSQVCLICGKAFLTPSALKDHMDYHNPNGEKKYSCPVCNVAFHKDYHMKLHLKIYHKDDTSRRKESDAKQDFLDPPRVQTDADVDYTETPDEQVDADMADEEHLSSFCAICGKQVKQSDMEGHQNKHNDFRPYKCKRGCGQAMGFHSQTSRNNHYRFVHSEEQECGICHKLYPSEASLNSHKKYMHVEKRFKCYFCDKTFTMSSHAKQHMQRNHLQV